MGKKLFLKKFLRQIKGNLKNNSNFVKVRNLRWGATIVITRPARQKY